VDDEIRLPGGQLLLVLDSAGVDEGIQDRSLEADVLAELHVGDAPLGDQPADKAFTGPEVVPGLGDSEERVVGAGVRQVGHIDERPGAVSCTAPAWGLIGQVAAGPLPSDGRGDLQKVSSFPAPTSTAGASRSVCPVLEKY
jgi:hypothetical protein